ncbi:MAG TPA: ABC transporter permease [Slackia equolifaciens]|uniref:ABC transporter permease n=1 Tax=Slackia equolifaciens TaxID=498718 RepID=A0A9D3A1A6_9ACTN|nr:ABC transporter permease [Slackia equolifaciens]
MLATLREIFQENWEWRRQILNLAVIDLHKTVRGAVLGWAWLFVKPLTYIAVFWFALDLGLRAGDSTGGDYPYILWLSAGLIPWFFMQSMLGTGANVYRRYPFLVNRIHFPLSAISNFYALAEFIIFLCLMAGLLVLCLIAGVHLTIYALQLPLIWVLMYFFWVCFSVMVSPLSALSKDFSNLLKALSTPLFWISGIIYNVASMNIPLIHQIMAFNPITFFCTAQRAALCDHFWIWDKPGIFVPFLLVFALTAVAALRNYHKLRKDVADVI